MNKNRLVTITGKEKCNANALHFSSLKMIKKNLPISSH